MPSFTEVMRDHEQLKNTIIQIEQTKNKIKKNEYQLFPPEEIALRTSDREVGPSDFGTGITAGEEVQGLDISVGLKALQESITTGYLPPYQANQMWRILVSKIGTTSPTLTTYKDYMTQTLSLLETRPKFKPNEIGTIKGIIDKLLTNLQPTPASPTIVQLDPSQMNQLINILTTVATSVPPPPSVSSLVAPASVPPAPSAPSAPISSSASTLSLPIPPPAGLSPLNPGDLTTPTLPPAPSPPLPPRPLSGSAGSSSTPFGTPSSTVGTPATVAIGGLPTVSASTTLSADPPESLVPTSLATAFEDASSTNISKSLKEFQTELEKLDYVDLGSDTEAYKTNYNTIVEGMIPSIKSEHGKNKSEKINIIGYYLLGKALGKDVSWVLTSTNEPRAYEVRDKILAGQKSYWTDVSNSISGTPKKTAKNKAKLTKIEYEFVYRMSKNPDTTIINSIYPVESAAAGSGLKAIKSGRRTIKSETAKVNDLVSAISMGNRTKQVFKQLENSLMFLVKKGKISSEYANQFYYEAINQK